jgi:hypothetical protein
MPLGEGDLIDQPMRAQGVGHVSDALEAAHWLI